MFAIPVPYERMPGAQNVSTRTGGGTECLAVQQHKMKHVLMSLQTPGLIRRGTYNFSAYRIDTDAVMIRVVKMVRRIRRIVGGLK